MVNLITIYFDGNSYLQLNINLWLVVIPLVGILIYIRLTRHLCSRNYEINETELGIGNTKVRFKPNYDDIQIAYKLWVELNTRKIGLVIDVNNDVINEVYNSWYEFFKITRELIKDIPAQKIKKNESTQKLVRISIDVLNNGIRPHLTKWQARFSKWYEYTSKESMANKLSPQDLQKKFPEFQELIHDMLKVNHNMIKYKEKLNEIIMGCKR